MELYLDSNDARSRVRAGDADAPGMGAPREMAIDPNRAPKAASLSDFGLSLALPGTPSPQPSPQGGATQQAMQPTQAQRSPTLADFGLSLAVAPTPTPAPAVKPQEQEQPTGDYSAGDFALDMSKMAGGSLVGGTLQAPQGVQDASKKLVRDTVTGDLIDQSPIPGVRLMRMAQMAFSDAIGIRSFKDQIEDKEKARIAVDRALSGVNVPGLRDLADYGKQVQKDIVGSMSTEGKSRLKGSTPSGNLLKGELSFGDDPTLSGYALQFAGVFGSLAPVVATTLITRNPNAGAAVGGSMAAGEGASSARDFVDRQSHDVLMANSPFYSTMIQRGVPQAEAKEIIKDRAAESSAILQGMVAAVGDRITGKMLTGAYDDILRRVGGSTVAGRVAAGAVGGAIEEGTQEVLEGVAADIGVASVVKNKEIGEDSAANLILGAVGGAPVSAVRGLIASDDATKGKINKAKDLANKEVENSTTTELDDGLALRSATRINDALKNNREGVLNVMTAIWNSESELTPDGKQNPVRAALETTAVRAGIIDDFNKLKQSESAVEAGNQMMSDYPRLRDDFLTGAMNYANVLPTMGRMKFDKRGTEVKTTAMSEEDVMNAPTPDEMSESVTPSATEQQINEVKQSESPGLTASSFIKQSAYSENLSQTDKDTTSSAPDQYGVVTVTSNTDPNLTVYQHPALGDFAFNKRDDLFNAFKLLEAANESAKQRRNAKMDENTKPSAVDEDVNPMDLLDEPTDEQAPAGENKVDLAKRNLEDAVFNLWDVASDASNTKMNIMGKRYTAKDLPGAIQKVMEALVKLGYVKLSEISEKLIERMKANENWKHLVDKVTPEMLRSAYDKLPKFDGKQEAAELDTESNPAIQDKALPKRTVSDLVKALPVVVKNMIESGETKNPEDMEVMVKRRLRQNPEWSHLEPKVSPAMVKQAYAQATNSLVSVNENEATGTYKKGRTISAAKVANQKLADEQAKTEPTAEDLAPKKERSDIEQKKTDLVSAIRGIYNQSSNGSFFQGLVDDLVSRIEELDQQIASLNLLEVTNEDGSVTQFWRRGEGSDTMERQMESTGRQQSPDEYYAQVHAAAFENPESRPALLAKRRILELELNNAMSDKSDKLASIGKLGFRTIRRQIDLAIQDAVKNGLPMEETIEIGREWLASIDNYLRVGKVERAEKAAQQAEEMQNFIEMMNQTAESVSLPSDYEFGFGIVSDLRSKKIKLFEAIDLIDQADARGELSSKKAVVSQLLTEMIGDFKLVYEAKLALKKKSGVDTSELADETWSEHPASTLASKYKKDGLLKFDDLQTLFSKNNADMPHSLLKSSEVAASIGLLEYMRENKFDPSFRFYWLRSMDRVVRFNKSLLDSMMYTELEKDLYSEWREQMTAINSRTRQQDSTSDIKQDYPDLLFNKYSLDDMRIPTRLSPNVRTRLQQLYPNLVTAFFNDIRFALRNGYPAKDIIGGMDVDDRQEFLDWVKAERKSEQEMADRMQRQTYYAKLSQFRNIDDETFASLYKMMREDSIANLPMIYDMAARIEKSAIEGQNIDPETGEISDMPKKKSKASQRTKEEQQFYDEQSANDDQALADVVQSAVMRSIMGDKGVSDATLRGRRDVLLDFAAYRDAVESRFSSYDEQSGDQNRNTDEDSLDDLYAAGVDPDVANLLDLDQEENEDSDEDKRLRQGQYMGILSTALVMDHVRKITAKWKNAPNIVVLQSHMQLPEGLRDAVSKKLERGMGAKGMFDPNTGTVYLFSNFIKDNQDVEFTLFHEAYGHLGLRLMFGKDFDTFLQNMYDSNADVRQAADALYKQGGKGRLESIEEVLSDMAGMNENVGVVEAFLGKIISMLRNIGLDKVANFIGIMTNAELAYALKSARQYAEESGGRSPLANGPQDIRMSEERPPYEIYSLSNGNTTGYARYDPLSDQWYVFTATAGDIRAGNKVQVMTELDKVIERMQKLGKIERRVRSGFFRDNKVPADFVRFQSSLEAGRFMRRFDMIVRALQNQYLPVFRLVEQMEAIGRVSKQLDLRRYLRTTERQTAVMMEDFHSEFVDPIYDYLKDAEKSGGDFTAGAENIYEMLNKFLLAQTADERNLQVNSRNPTEYAGSGMPSASTVKAMKAIDASSDVRDEAQEILDFVESQPYAEAFNKIGRLLDKMSERKVEWERKTGLIDDKEAASRQAAYMHYRNLSGINNMLDPDMSGDPSLNVNRKFNMRGKDHYALGRADEAPDILARTIVAAQASIVRGNKNKVAQRILAFFETNYDPNFVTINEQSKIKKIGSDGFVQLVENDQYIRQPDVFVTKVRGRPVTIRFKDYGYNSIVEAIHGKIEPQSDNPVMNVIRAMTRFSGKAITTYNPFWVGVNFIRDIGTLFLNAAVNRQVGAKLAGKMMLQLVPSLHTTLHIATAEWNVQTPAGKAAKAGLLKFLNLLPPNQDLLNSYYEGRKNGAFTSFINNKNLEEQIIEINKAVYGKSVFDHVKGLLKFWELVTIPVEMAPRLSAYHVTKENGWDKLDAADYAGQVTVDFNMRGAMGSIRDLYLFFNPAVQGTTQLVKLAKENPGRFTAAAGLLLTLGMLESLIQGKAAGDDDEKRKRKEKGLTEYDELPDYKRSTSLIVNPNTRMGAIPLPLGWAWFKAAGAYMGDSMFRGVPVDLTLKRMVSSLFDAVSPVGAGAVDLTKLASDPVGQAFAIFTPTVGMPLVQWEMNKNHWGGPLYKTESFGKEGASATTMAFDSVNPISKSIAELTQEVTGGYRYNQKGVDINPALLDHLVQSYVPGLASEMYKGAGLAVRKAKGLDIPREKELFFDRFSAYPNQNFDAGAYMRVRAKVNGLFDELKQLPVNSPRRAEILKDHPAIGSVKNSIDIAEANLRSIRGQLATIENSAYQAKLAGKMELYDKYEAQAVTFRNSEKAAEKVLFGGAVQMANKAGFRREILGE